jgi:hypothetical protein
VGEVGFTRLLTSPVSLQENIMTSRTVITAAAKAILAMDKACWENKGSEDGKAFHQARTLLWNVLERNGYELCEPGSARVRKSKKH